MRLRSTALLVLAALVAGAVGGSRLGAGAARSPGGPQGARIERVVDGDTMVVSGVGKVRLIGIDTPEVYGGAECFGREASAYAKRLLPAGTPVRYRLGTEPRDRYGRALVYLFLRDGRHVNELLAREGYAQPLTIPPNVEYAERFAALARGARRAGRGLWSACGPR
jgi:micrococcal nuclease